MACDSLAGGTNGGKGGRFSEIDREDPGLGKLRTDHDRRTAFLRRCLVLRRNARGRGPAEALGELQRVAVEQLAGTAAFHRRLRSSRKFFHDLFRQRGGRQFHRRLGLPQHLADGVFAADDEEQKDDDCDPHSVKGQKSTHGRLLFKDRGQADNPLEYVYYNNI